jgi:peptidoglycan hydrolase CwlO-like protein
MKGKGGAIIEGSMADTTDLLTQILSRLDEQGRDIKSVKQDVATVKDVQQVHGGKLDTLDGKVNTLDGKADRLEDGQNRQYTTMKILQGTIEETKAEVDKLLRRPRQAD